eukprot:jgi/Orpsp1_1/1174908/evm.model.c7180000051916.1
MKFLTFASTLIATGALASVCHDNYDCCTGCDVTYTDDEGKWSIEKGNWCFIDEDKCFGNQNSDFPSCNGCEVIYTDDDGKWGVEKND